MDNTAWMGVVAPPGLPAATQEALRGALSRVLSDPAVRQRFADSGIAPLGGTSAEFSTRIRGELSLRRKIVADQKLKLD
jgi:tripartite-type tricarboxylate transporter receptor subunit TctC